MGFVNAVVFEHLASTSSSMQVIHSLRLLWISKHSMMTSHVPNSSSDFISQYDAVRVTYPDPWWGAKRREHRRAHRVKITWMKEGSLGYLGPFVWRMYILRPFAVFLFTSMFLTLKHRPWRPQQHESVEPAVVLGAYAPKSGNM